MTDEAPFRRAHCDVGAPEVARWVSRDIIHAAVEERATINVASAVQHPKFRMSPSVIENGIRAVMCAPIGVADPVGVVYVQGRHVPGRFADDDRERLELFAARLATISDRLRFGRTGEPVTLDDELKWVEMRAVRASLERNRGNLAATARELGITRARLYRIVRRAG
ncbi:MAG: GAF domain-containing protein [Deltaproteobacteria bacterium]|nr:GAF domain-containing protein [Deltaproteobacteria bacterium]